ncbi:DUF3492 domain-containing protein [Streptomyces sp. NPDC006984]|uniref:DUF3492 domain-containing protein n=1 Tax=Streptomyces sp. NPDC006984 TaxID=3155463 RepID=UPI0033DCB9D4
MRIGLITHGGYPYAKGENRLWCERLVHGLTRHEFDVYAASSGPEQERSGLLPLPPQARLAATAAPWAPPEGGAMPGRRGRRRAADLLTELLRAVCADGGSRPHGPANGADGFAEALYGLAEFARTHGELPAALRSEPALRAVESACRVPGAHRALGDATAADLLRAADALERALRPLSFDWYQGGALDAADLCHAVSGGPGALPGLVAKRFCGVPLLVTEYGVQVRTHHLAARWDGRGPAVRALLAAFHRRLAREVYTQAALVTSGNAHARRWQEQCGADRTRLRTVHPGLAAERFAAVGEGPEGEERTLVWVGRPEPGKDLVALLHAFAEVRKAEPAARLRLFTTPPQGGRADGPADGYLAQCRALAAQLFPDEADGAHAVGHNPVSFEEIGSPEAPEPADAYAAGCLVVHSSVVEGFPATLVEAMLCGRATVSTDAGAVVEAIGGTGLVVPPRNPRALADACLALLRDPERRARLGAAARARALELFTAEQNVTAFGGLYLELISHSPVRRAADAVDAAGDPVPFAHPAESRLPGRWNGAGHVPAWASGSDTAPDAKEVHR